MTTSPRPPPPVHAVARPLVDAGHTFVVRAVPRPDEPANVWDLTLTRTRDGRTTNLGGIWREAGAYSIAIRRSLCGHPPAQDTADATFHGLGPVPTLQGAISIGLLDVVRITRRRDWRTIDESQLIQHW